MQSEFYFSEIQDGGSGHLEKLSSQATLVILHPTLIKFQQQINSCKRYSKRSRPQSLVGNPRWPPPSA
jgi:hypothetical protein